MLSDYIAKHFDHFSFSNCTIDLLTFCLTVFFLQWMIGRRSGVFPIFFAESPQ